MKIIIALAVAGIVAGAGVAAKAQGFGATTQSVRVAYDDLNLGTASGQSMLNRRIQKAAMTVCGGLEFGSTPDLAVQRAHKTCVDETLAAVRIEIAAKTGAAYASR